MHLHAQRVFILFEYDTYLYWQLEESQEVQVNRANSLQTIHNMGNCHSHTTV